MRLPIQVVIVLVQIALVCAWDADDPMPDHFRSAADWGSHWREGGYDAVTSLYVLLRVQNKPIRYEDLVSDRRLVGKCSFATLFAVAKERGEDVVLRKCTATELNRIPLPAIIHLDAQRDSSAGEFVSLINRSRNSWTTVNGANGTLGELNSGVLLRQWSGYVMSIRQPRFQWHVILAAVLLGGLMGIISGPILRAARVNAGSKGE